MVAPAHCLLITVLPFPLALSLPQLLIALCWADGELSHCNTGSCMPTSCNIGGSCSSAQCGTAGTLPH